MEKYQGVRITQSFPVGAYNQTNKKEEHRNIAQFQHTFHGLLPYETSAMLNFSLITKSNPQTSCGYGWGLLLSY